MFQRLRVSIVHDTRYSATLRASATAQRKTTLTFLHIGCYQCSQRRIDCDGTKPSCAKCTTRGIACSGFGPRFRFLDGFSSRRRKPLVGAGIGIMRGMNGTQPNDSPIQTYSSLVFPPSHSSRPVPDGLTGLGRQHRLPHDPNLETNLDFAFSEPDGDICQPSVIDDQDSSSLDEYEAVGFRLEHSSSAASEDMTQAQADCLDAWASDEPLGLARARKLSLMLVDLSLFEPWKEFLLVYCLSTTPSPDPESKC